MTTASGAYNVIRARIENNVPLSQGVPVPVRWQNEDAVPLPDVPAPFVYVEFNPDPASLVSFGGGQTSNRYRNPAVIDAYCFVPRGWGLVAATDLAEMIATLFRSYRDADISCFDATVYPLGSGSSVKPPGLDSEVDNYYVATTQITLFFDLIG